ncbi:hypothetical protein [Bradyrhizobium neotropicale]|uniref:hypothetical protein n=1 Tax=Bradyrhizobium neotropicale TaxID=1497615 RepID=UPI001AD6FB36|nr:hypothetical protein [Bradyrhizobium neotropicale]MBO4225081.1 hypothetical protein [Bradyrhizobium neotropicale]
MLLAQPSWTPLRRALKAIIAGCCKLIGAVCDPYRPERHYMRGPGPRWRAKQRSL